jgi:hypothetical protein
MSDAPAQAGETRLGDGTPVLRVHRRVLGLLTGLCQCLAGGYLLYRLKSMAGINLSSHYHAVEIFWHPREVLQDLANSWFV